MVGERRDIRRPTGCWRLAVVGSRSSASIGTADRVSARSRLLARRPRSARQVARELGRVQRRRDGRPDLGFIPSLRFPVDGTCTFRKCNTPFFLCADRGGRARVGPRTPHLRPLRARSHGARRRQVARLSARVARARLSTLALSARTRYTARRAESRRRRERGNHENRRETDRGWGEAPQGAGRASPPEPVS